MVKNMHRGCSELSSVPVTLPSDAQTPTCSSTSDTHNLKQTDRQTDIKENLKVDVPQDGTTHVRKTTVHYTELSVSSEGHPFRSYSLRGPRRPQNSTGSFHFFITH